MYAAVVPHCGKVGTGAWLSFQAAHQGYERAAAMSQDWREHYNEAALGGLEGMTTILGSSTGRMDL